MKNKKCTTGSLRPAAPKPLIQPELFEYPPQYKNVALKLPNGDVAYLVVGPRQEKTLPRTIQEHACRGLEKLFLRFLACSSTPDIRRKLVARPRPTKRRHLQPRKRLHRSRRSPS
jgi:hypothetical protein